MKTEREKMLAGELYDPLDPELVAGRERARELCRVLHSTREAESEARRRLRELFGAGGDTVWTEPTVRQTRGGEPVPRHPGRCGAGRRFPGCSIEWVISHSGGRK